MRGGKTKEEMIRRGGEMDGFHTSYESLSGQDGF